MKYKALIASCVLAACAIAVLPASAETARNVFKTIFTRSIVLQGKDSFIKRKGDKPVVIRDNARVRGNLTVTGTINGESISDMVSDIGMIDAVVAQLQANALPEGCAEGESAEFNGTDWVCATDDDTTYAAGNGIDITSGTIGVQECGNGEIMRMNGGIWVCSEYAPIDSYGHFLVVAQTGANYSTISAAIDAINTAGDAGPSNRYVIWVAPGSYSATFTLPDYTDLIGASRDSVSLVGSGTTATTGAITAGVSTTVSNVTVTALGDGDVTGIYVGSGDSLELNNSIVYISEITGDTARAVFNAGGSLVVRDSDISAGESASAAFGVDSDGRLTIERSNLHVRSANQHNDLRALLVSSTGYPVIVKDTELEAGGSGDSTGANNCITFYFQGNGAELSVQNSVFNAEDCDGNERAAHLQGSNTSVATISNSQFFGEDANAFTTFEITARIAGSLLQSGGETSSSNNTCVYSYSEDYVALADNCELVP